MMKWPTRTALRFVHLRAPTAVIQAISGELHRVLKDAELGLHDGPALFDQMRQDGLQPRWMSRSSIQVEDPMAGLLMVCFEHVAMSIH
ncbi:hypothetical protein [Pseudomonas gingeri]|uniref:hypothetical protein n=1 Tax=Pseudomonas gingeri TaxID=117681 RepID=UPI00210913F3|nr:hypothetical protein [Pseudomonas gingeri]